MDKVIVVGDLHLGAGTVISKATVGGAFNMNLPDISSRCMTRNQTRYLILGILSIESNKSGYDIRKAVESSVSYFWRESYGQIYPTLKRLAAEGLIVPRKSGARGRPERQEYSLTAKGHACLEEWLGAPYREKQDD